MENKEELKEKLLSLLTRETSLSTASEALELSAYETLGLVKDIQDSGVNIVVNVKDDDAYLINFFNGKNLVIINRDTTNFDNRADLVINKDLGEVFKKLK